MEGVVQCARRVPVRARGMTACGAAASVWLAIAIVCLLSSWYFRSGSSLRSARSNAPTVWRGLFPDVGPGICCRAAIPTAHRAPGKSRLRLPEKPPRRGEAQTASLCLSFFFAFSFSLRYALWPLSCWPWQAAWWRPRLRLAYGCATSFGLPSDLRIVFAAIRSARSALRQPTLMVGPRLAAAYYCVRRNGWGSPASQLP